MAASAAELSRWTPEDSIALRYYSMSQREPYAWPFPDGQEIYPSPDAEYFFVVSHHGDLALDTFIYTLQVFSTRPVRRALDRNLPAPKPVREMSYRSNGNEPGLKLAAWSTNAAEICFLTADSNGIQQLYALDIRTGTVKQITHYPRNIVWFREHAGKFLIGATSMVRPIEHSYPIQWATLAPVGQLEPEELEYQRVMFEPDFFITGVDRPAMMVPLADSFARSLASIVHQDRPVVIFSPDGSNVSWESNTRRVTLDKPAFNNIDVRVIQSANTPPRLIASGAGRQVVLDDPDPVLEKTGFARSQPFSWRESNGDRVTGGLILPRNYTGGTRIPLVIQAYHYYPQFFLPDGPHAGTKDAAQVLAAHGMAVLQIDKSTEDPNPTSTAREGPAFVEKIDAVVDALVGQGIVDPDRIGLSGFSRGGYLTYFAITHPQKVRLAAAVIADATTQSYVQFLKEGGLEPTNGGMFWQDKSTWLDLETTFNVNRVQTPALFSQHGQYVRFSGRYGVIAVSTINAFSLNHKPFDYIFFPQGEHLLRRPLERLTLMTVVLDWMSFWLQDKETPAALNDALCHRPNVLAIKDNDLSVHPQSEATVKPWYWLDCTPEGIGRVRHEREAMYVRWRKLREQQNDVLKQPPPPKGKYILCDTNETTRAACAQGL